MTTAPEKTADLVRSVPFQVESASDDGLTFRGYAAVFGASTVIDSWEGRFEETVAPGAFKRTLSERTPVFQFDHGQHPMIGSIPLGKITEAREDARGVYVEARLHDNWLTQPVRDAIASKSITGMSFRFEPLQDRWVDHDGSELRDVDQIRRAISRSEGPMPRRTLVQVRSKEMGPVVFPAYEDTTAEVRSVTLDLSRMDDPEQQRTLAHVVFAADAAATDPPDSPEGTDKAADHEERDAEPPQATPMAGEHGSETAEPEGLRDAIARRREQHAARLRFALEGAHRYE